MHAKLFFFACKAIMFFIRHWWPDMLLWAYVMQNLVEMQVYTLGMRDSNRTTGDLDSFRSSAHLTSLRSISLSASLSRSPCLKWRKNCEKGQKLIVVVLAVRNHHQNLHPSAPPTWAAKPPFVSPPLAPSPGSYTPAKPLTSPSPAAKPPFLSPPLAPSPGSYTPAKPPASPSPAAVTPSVLTPPAPSPEAYTLAKPPHRHLRRRRKKKYEGDGHCVDSREERECF
ncbi:hypothetical protein FH972_000494 [Carpinus fangiana]|uniref:Uncharacterized protein n=1 Tax=Carpinus fangiana TaxID=176857 RepID=A0A5N6QBI2_9ROSI|nr:hypothetical protein FH972_000494 [Carpinus fangiana]